MTTLLALLAGMGITLLVVVFVMAGDEGRPRSGARPDEPAAPPVQSQDVAPAAPETRYVKDPATGEWVNWEEELRSIQSFGGLEEANPNAQPNLEDLLDAQAKARER